MSSIRRCAMRRSRLSARSASRRVGCNIQFAVHPDTGEMLVVEMNPRVSRSLRTSHRRQRDFRLRVSVPSSPSGYLLDELPNDITKTTPASFEPTLDYVVCKFPRFAFEKFPTADPTLGVQMKAVGEVMAIGRTFKQAWQKGLRGLENGRDGWEIGARPKDDGLPDDNVGNAARCDAPSHCGPAIPAQARVHGRASVCRNCMRSRTSIRGSSISSRSCTMPSSGLPGSTASTRRACVA